MHYDIIGDVHGQAQKLEQLLNLLGYKETNGVYCHPLRKAIFVGDLIDRGTNNKRVVEIVRGMVDANQAYAVMGNHEFNAICYHTETAPGVWLRPHDDDNDKQHGNFLVELPYGYPETKAVIDWFKTLPIFLELENFRVIHACWNKSAIDWIRPKLGKSNTLTEQLIVEASNKVFGVSDEWNAFKAIEVLLKGPEIPLPHPHYFEDKDKKRRHAIRVGWWDGAAATYGAIALDPTHVNAEIFHEQVPDTSIQPYADDELPVIFGHYWRNGKIKSFRSNVACVDYSAGKGGPLVAYCWPQDSKRIEDHNFVHSE